MNTLYKIVSLKMTSYCYLLHSPLLQKKFVEALATAALK